MKANQADVALRAREFGTRLDALVAHIDQLPTLPQILWEIIAQLQNSNNAAADLASAIEDDPSLTANVLRLVNSAHYGFSERFISVRDAVVALGRREIERIVGAAAVIDTFGPARMRGSMDYSAFWIHCLQVAEAAEHVSTLHCIASPYMPSEAYMGGLLHDIGKLIMSQFLSDDWDRVVAHAEQQGRGIAAAEREVLGMDHGEVAARLMGAWGFPPSIIEGTRWHHRVADLPRRTDVHYAEVIDLANTICHDYAGGFLGDEAITHPRLYIDRRQVSLLARSLSGAAKRATLLLS